jgi:putative ABC transport system permease protein
MLRGAPALLVRTRANVAADETNTAIRHAVEDVEADVVVSRIAEMRDLMAASLADDRLRTVLITLFAAIAAVLAAVGTYGVASAAAARRTREMAIRVAVGATAASVARLIVAGTARGVMAGGVAGIALALGGTRILSPYLYGIRATDPAVYAGVALLLTITTLIATWSPARRAMRVRVVETLSAD